MSAGLVEVRQVVVGPECGYAGTAVSETLWDENGGTVALA